jgi:hypothetical protein
MEPFYIQVHRLPHIIATITVRTMEVEAVFSTIKVHHRIHAHIRRHRKVWTGKRPQTRGVRLEAATIGRVKEAERPEIKDALHLKGNVNAKSNRSVLSVPDHFFRNRDFCTRFFGSRDPGAPGLKKI